MESGQSEGTLENVFLRLTQESEEERAAAVAERFGRDEGPYEFEGEFEGEFDGDVDEPGDREARP
jgi:hypothetical protein